MYFVLVSCHLETRDFVDDGINVELFKQLLGMRHCHLAPPVRDDSVLWPLEENSTRGASSLAKSAVHVQLPFSTARQVLAPLLRPCLQEFTDRKNVGCLRSVESGLLRNKTQFNVHKNMTCVPND